ncbi:hypothetical protein [Vibrio vulnificus]|uniref:hypothetical protein n=1 Tax=Vibrio vulnificus TaxID=672 RepID=UPI0019D4135F|nr:hypothetical protein [Vibrio vulnificus]MBN8115006.1 hypothetical protein [Vibrio vulnificus]HAS6107041.1 hypothetical protein [Vibrio vulnificus]HDY8172267.1 hypothetical protein [Vibrio vulnificus]
MLIIKVEPQDVKTETVSEQFGDKPPVIRHVQTCLVSFGGRSQMEYKIKHNQPELRLDAGLYVLDGSCYSMDERERLVMKPAYRHNLVLLSDALQPIKSDVLRMLKD